MAVKISNELEQIIVNNYKDGKSPYWMVNNIEELKGKRPSVIYGILKRLGVELRRKITITDEQKLSRRKYNVNDDYFENIDTDEKAYWLGFMYADGWVITNQDKLGITIAEVDREHLVKFKKAVQSESEIKTYVQKSGYANGEKYVRILITSKKMKADLVAHGVTEKKTDIITFPKHLDKNLYSSFIRGYYDGDGCLTYGGTQVNGKKKFNIKIVGTDDMLININKIFDTKVKLIKRHPERDTNNYTITICGNVQVRRIMDYMYKDCTVCLDRKYEKYLELVNQ